jgi:hypothetical protein
VADQLHDSGEASGTPGRRPDPASGRLPGRDRSAQPALAGPETFADDEWVNEGGSLAPAPREGGAARQAASNAAPGKEARDTVSGCRDRAVQDLLHAASASTENSRNVFHRSAAAWEARANELEEGEDDSAQQRATDRDLWESAERFERTRPRK